MQATERLLTQETICPAVFCYGNSLLQFDALFQSEDFQNGVEKHNCSKFLNTYSMHHKSEDFSYKMNMLKLHNHTI